MNDYQFKALMEKLEEIRCGIIDVENIGVSVTPCERHSCCNCGNASCPLNSVNCSKFEPISPRGDISLKSGMTYTEGGAYHE
jgi:hypothetical protein